MTVFTRMRWFGLLAAIGFLAILSGSPAHAAFIISGNTFLDGATDGISGNDDLSGTDNWVVLHTADITAAMKSSFVPGTDSGAFDDSSAATVIYQPDHRWRGRGSMEDIRDRMTRRIASGLNLSQEQTEQVRQIVGEKLVRLRKIRREILPEMKEQAAALNGEVDAILTDEQRTRWEQRYAKLYDRWFARRDAAESPARGRGRGRGHGR